MSKEAMQKALDALERYEYAEARVILRAVLSEPVQPIGPLAGCVAVWCEEASEDVADWGSYTPEYFQQKHGLQEDIDKWKKRAEQCYNAAPLGGYVMVPVEPSDGLLMSMAIRYDHGLGMDGYYDSLYGEGEQKKRLDATLRKMRQLHEEVVYKGFYLQGRDVEYEVMLEAVKGDAT